MREIITTTGASLFTAGVIIAQAIAAPAVSPAQSATTPALIHVAAQR